MGTLRELCVTTIRGLPSSDRLRLATLILEDLAESAAPMLDCSDAWTQEDLRDVTAFSQQSAGWPGEEDSRDQLG